MAWRKSSSDGNRGWRKFLVGALIALGCLGLVGATAGAWLRGLVFDTDRWVATVTPVPQDPAVAKALGVYASDALFEGVDAEAQIEAALPPQAAFLAGPLTTELQTATADLAESFVRSDQFQTIWVDANRAAHERLVTFIDRPPVQRNGQAGELQLKLDALVEKVRERSGAQTVFAPPHENRIAIAQSKTIAKWRTVLRNLHRSPAVWPAWAAAFLLAAVAFSRRRQATVLAGGISVAVTGIVSLVVLKIIRSNVVDQGVSQIDQNAIGAVWGHASSGLTRTFIVTIVLGAGVTAGAAIAGPYGWAKQLRAKTGVSRVAGSAFAKRTHRYRVALGHQFRWAALAGGVAGLLLLLIPGTVTWFTALAAVGWYAAYVAALRVVAARR